MYIKAYIFWNGNESEDPFLISNFTKKKKKKKRWYFEKMAKNHFFGKKKSWTAYKDNFELKMLKLFENYVKTKV